MNGETPSVPITTLAGIASLTDCKYKMPFLNAHFETHDILILISYNYDFILICICVFVRQDNSAALFSHALFTIGIECEMKTGTAYYFSIN